MKTSKRCVSGASFRPLKWERNGGSIKPLCGAGSKHGREGDYEMESVKSKYSFGRIRSRWAVKAGDHIVLQSDKPFEPLTLYQDLRDDQQKGE